MVLLDAEENVAGLMPCRRTEKQCEGEAVGKDESRGMFSRRIKY